MVPPSRPQAAADMQRGEAARRASGKSDQHVPPLPSSPSPRSSSYSSAPILPRYHDDELALLPPDNEKRDRQIPRENTDEKWRVLQPRPITNISEEQCSQVGTRQHRGVRAVTIVLLVLSSAATLVVLGCGLAGYTPGLCSAATQRYEEQQRQSQHIGVLGIPVEGVEQSTYMSEAEIHTGGRPGGRDADELDLGQEQHRGSSYLENRPTRDATLKPRKLADLPARYLPGYRSSKPSTHDIDTPSPDVSPQSKAGKPHHNHPSSPPPWAPGRPRLIVIGDVHGELEILQQLLDKIGYTSPAQGGRDHVVLAGDIINKGPDTPGVLDLAIQEGFSGVRGNHDDCLLRLYEKHRDKKKGKKSKGKKKEKAGKSGLGEELEDEDDVSEEDEVDTYTEGDVFTEEEDEDEEPLDDDDREDDEEDEEDGNKLSSALGSLDMSGHQQQQPLGGSSQDDNDDIDSAKHKKSKKNKHRNKKKNKHHGISKKDRRGLSVIRSCTPEQRRWLANLPLILRVGHIPYIPGATSPLSMVPSGERQLQTGRVVDAAKPSIPTPYSGQVVVVHGGLVPGIELEKQDPWALLHMRTLLLEKKNKKDKGKKHHKDKKDKKKKDKKLKHKSTDTDEDSTGTDTDEGISTTALIPLETREGIPWARVWDKFQRKHYDDSSDRTTVVFGHDAHAGLQKGEYSFGLDTGCVAGGKLTAMVFFEVAETKAAGAGPDLKPVRVAHEFISVSCKASGKQDLESKLE